MKKALLIRISGKVQGVFFRDTTKRIADDLRITGYVKNLQNGDVEAFAEGEENQLKQFLEFCRTGPSSAVVSQIEAYEKEIKSYKKFKIEL